MRTRRFAVPFSPLGGPLSNADRNGSAPAPESVTPASALPEAAETEAPRFSASPRPESAGPQSRGYLERFAALELETTTSPQVDSPRQIMGRMLHQFSPTARQIVQDFCTYTKCRRTQMTTRLEGVVGLQSHRAVRLVVHVEIFRGLFDRLQHSERWGRILARLGVPPRPLDYLEAVAVLRTPPGSGNEMPPGPPRTECHVLTSGWDDEPDASSEVWRPSAALDRLKRVLQEELDRFVNQGSSNPR